MKKKWVTTVIIIGFITFTLGYIVGVIVSGINSDTYQKRNTIYELERRLHER